MLSRLQPRLVGRSGDGRDDILLTPLPRTDSMNADRKTCAEFPCLLRVSGPSSAPQLQGLQCRQVRAQAGPGRLVGRLHDCRPGCRGDEGRDDNILAHYHGARCTAVAPISTPTLHRRLEQL
jgi:hypothetical protein